MTNERKYNFYAALMAAQDSHDVNVSEPDFESSAFVAWKRIGNFDYEIVKEKFYVPENGILILPCEVDYIESVNYMNPDFQSDFSHTSNHFKNRDTEKFIDKVRKELDPLVNEGKYAKYTVLSPNQIKLVRGDLDVEIIYKKLKQDENGLPMLTFKEVQALACYVAYEYFYKKSLATKDQFFYSVAQAKNQEWNLLCDDARVPELLNQNDINEVMDVQYSYNRKRYGKSYKPFM